MTIPFGPQLIGQTEKTLNALLTATLGDRLTEPEWVTLRVAHQLDEQIGSGDELAAEVADRARFADAEALVAGLTSAGLLRDGRPTDRGRALFTELFAQVNANAAPIWDGLPTEDVAAAGRVLNEVLNRARAVQV
jgi:hypothetical protein